jgi:hypothetical protein
MSVERIEPAVRELIRRMLQPALAKNPEQTP